MADEVPVIRPHQDTIRLAVASALPADLHSTIVVTCTPVGYSASLEATTKRFPFLGGRQYHIKMPAQQPISRQFLADVCSSLCRHFQVFQLRPSWSLNTEGNKGLITFAAGEFNTTFTDQNTTNTLYGVSGSRGWSSVEANSMSRAEKRHLDVSFAVLFSDRSAEATFMHDTTSVLGDNEVEGLSTIETFIYNTVQWQICIGQYHQQTMLQQLLPTAEDILEAADDISCIITKVLLLPISSPDGVPDVGIAMAQFVKNVVKPSESSVSPPSSHASGWDWLCHAVKIAPDTVRTAAHQASNTLKGWRSTASRESIVHLLVNAGQLEVKHRLSKNSVLAVSTGGDHHSPLRQAIREKSTAAVLICSGAENGLCSYLPPCLLEKILVDCQVKLVSGPVIIHQAIASRRGSNLMLLEHEDDSNLSNALSKLRSMLAERDSGSLVLHLPDWLLLRRTRQRAMVEPSGQLTSSCLDTLAQSLKLADSGSKNKRLVNRQPSSDTSLVEETSQDGLNLVLLPRRDLHTRVLLRTSSKEGTVNDILVKQAATIGSAIGLAAQQGGFTHVHITLYPEICSVMEHRFADRVVLQNMIADIIPGDLIVFASPDRAAREEDGFSSILRAVEDKLAYVAMVANCVDTTHPLQMLSEDFPACWATAQDVTKARKDAINLVSITMAALSLGHGSYISAHIYKKDVIRRISDLGAASLGPFANIANAIFRNKDVVSLARVSPTRGSSFFNSAKGSYTSNSAATLGLSPADAGEDLLDDIEIPLDADGAYESGESLNVEGNSIVRQHTFMSAFLNGANCKSILSTALREVSITQGSEHILKELDKVVAGGVLVVTSLDRITRKEGSLSELREAAERQKKHIVIACSRASVIQAAGDNFCEAAWGSGIIQQASTVDPEFLANVHDYNCLLQRFLPLLSFSVNNCPVLAPVFLVNCNPAVYSALLDVEKENAEFSRARVLGFSCRVNPDAKKGYDAGRMAGATMPDSSGERGLTSERLEKGVEVTRTAAEAVAPNAEVEIQWYKENISKSGNACWTCLSCSCGSVSGVPDPSCMCKCPKCKTARSTLHVCRHNDGCSCTAISPYNCDVCHKVPVAAPPKLCEFCHTKPPRRICGKWCSFECYKASCRSLGTPPRKCSVPGCNELAPDGGINGLKCNTHYKEKKNIVKEEKKNQCAVLTCSRTAETTSERNRLCGCCSIDCALKMGCVKCVNPNCEHGLSRNGYLMGTSGLCYRCYNNFGNNRTKKRR